MQSTQQTSASSFVSLPFLKFSHADDAAGETSKFSWVHTSHDLTLVLDTFRGGGSSTGGQPLVMKVIQGGQVLEHLDLEQKIQESLKVVETMRQLHVEVRVDQLPISGLSRCPLFAIRYSLPEKKVRRLQFKFASEKDFSVVHDLLARLGMHVTPYAAPAPISAKSTKTSEAKHTEPSTPTISDRSSTTASIQRTASTKLNHVQSYADRQLTATSLLASGQLGTTQMTPAPRPASSSYLQPDHQMQLSDDSYVSLSSDPVHRPSSVPSAFNTSSEGYMSIIPASSGSSRPVFWSTSTPAAHQFQPAAVHDGNYSTVQSSPGPIRRQGEMAAAVRSHFPRLQTLPENEELYDARPSTAPVLGTEECTSQVIPPKRDLPFRRTSSPGSSGRPSSASFDLPPLPPLPKPSFTDEPRPSSSPLTATASRRSEKSSDTGSSRPLSQLGKSVQNSKQAIHQNAHSGQTATSLGFPHVDQTVSRLASGAGSDNVEILAGFAAQAVDERRTMLNEFMIQHIGDDNFLTLCEDVWGCWRRIGLGLDG